MSRVINAIYARYTDLVEPFGIDESWLDMTGSWHLFGQSPAEVADALRDTVRTETGLTISVGVSFNKVFAKLGSDYRKPDATTVIFPEDVERIVHPLPVEALLYRERVTPSSRVTVICPQSAGASGRTPSPPFRMWWMRAARVAASAVVTTASGENVPSPVPFISPVS